MAINHDDLECDTRVEKRVSVIVVNWNGERFLKDCLGALSGQTYANYEVILVDNGSSDNSVRFVRDNFPKVRVVALMDNKGFTGAMRRAWMSLKAHT